MKNAKTVSFSPLDVAHVVKLANLRLSEDEVEKFSKQLRDILHHVDQLHEVDTSGVDPTYQTLDETTNVWREDEVKPSLSQDEALSQAKRTHQGYVVTKGVFE